MSKSRYSKTRAAGLLIGSTRHGKKFEFRTHKDAPVEVENRAMRRLREKK